jgi:hypothetical protein
MGKLLLATSVLGRLRGMLCERCGQDELLLAPCRDIHTYGMRHDIDVAFFSSAGEVVMSERNVKPGRRIRCKDACAVLERVADDDLGWYQEGQRVMMLAL